MNKVLKGSNSKFVVNLFKSFGVALSLVAVASCSDDKDKKNDKDKGKTGDNGTGGSTKTGGNTVKENDEELKGICKDEASFKEYCGKRGLSDDAKINVLWGVKGDLDSVEKVNMVVEIMKNEALAKKVLPVSFEKTVDGIRDFLNKASDLFKGGIVCKAGDGDNNGKLIFGFGEGEVLENNAETVALVAQMYGMNREMFGNDFASKVVFSDWDIKNGIVKVAIDGLKAVEGVKFDVVAGFNGLFFVSGVNGNADSIKVSLCGQDLEFSLKDFAEFKDGCQKLEALSGGRGLAIGIGVKVKMFELVAGGKFKIGDGNGIEVWKVDGSVDCKNLFEGLNALSKAGLFIMDKIEVKNRGNNFVDGNGIKVGVWDVEKDTASLDVKGVGA